MAISISHLGPPGTYTEVAALAYADWHQRTAGTGAVLCPYSSISKTIWAVVEGDIQLAVVPVENSIEGSVRMTLDTLWQQDALKIKKALVLPISHSLVSQAPKIQDVQVVYSHPQAIAQCQSWLEKHLPRAQLIPTNSTAEAIEKLSSNKMSGAISSQRAAQLYDMPVLAHPINDHPDNSTRFWILSLEPPQDQGEYTSLAFSLPKNVPGALLRPLQLFSERGINLSRIESRPTKRSLGDYLFFIDIEADANQAEVQAALRTLKKYTETLKLFGSYNLLPIQA